MSILTTAISAKGVFKALAKSRTVADQINQSCSEKGLPPAFPLNENGSLDIPGNSDYRFEGFGTILGIPPKVSFWVHYKSGTSEHVELGRFTVPLG